MQTKPISFKAGLNITNYNNQLTKSEVEAFKNAAKKLGSAKDNIEIALSDFVQHDGLLAFWLGKCYYFADSKIRISPCSEVKGLTTGPLMRSPFGEIQMPRGKRTVRLLLASSRGATRYFDPIINWSLQSVNPFRGNSYSM